MKICCGVNRKHASAERGIWNLAFKHHRKISIFSVVFEPNSKSKGHKCLGSLSERAPELYLSLSLSLSLYVSLSLSIFWVRSCLLITLIKCLKGHNSLGLLSERVL